MSTQHDIASTSKPQGKPFGGLAGLSVCLIFPSLVAAAAPAFSQDRSQSPDTQYQVERANCYNGRSNQDGATCLKEANAALAESRKGKLDATKVPYQKNATLRCQKLPVTDKADCERRMRGEGSVTGSAEAGGISRELVVQTPAAAK